MLFAWFFSWAIAVLVGFVLFDEPQLHCCSLVVVALAQVTLEVSLVAPVQEFGVRTKDFESWDWIVVFLHHVVKLWRTVFEAGWWVLVDHLAKPTV